MLAKRPVTLSLARPFSGLLELSNVAPGGRAKDDLPGGKFFRVAERGMGRARGGEPAIFQWPGRSDLRQHIPLKTLFGFGTIEKNMNHSGMCLKKFFKRIDDDGRFLDIAVEAAFAGAAFQHVPNRNARFQKPLRPYFIGGRGIELAQRAHNPPETILAVRIILPRAQRCLSRHAA